MSAENPAPGRPRQNLREILTIVLLFGSVAGAGLAFAWPWIPRESSGSAALARYAPVGDGRSALYAKVAASGATTWESQNQQVLRPGRALAGDLRKAQREAVRKHFLRPGEKELDDTELLRRLSGALLLRTVTRELKEGGEVSTTVSLSVRDRRGDHLLALYDVARDNDLVFEPAILALPTDLSAGRTWETRGKVAGVIDYGYTGRVLEAGPFRGRAGEFRDCRRVETRFVLTNAGSTLSDERWVGWSCAGVGLVDEQGYDASGKPTLHRVTAAAEGMSTVPGLTPPALPAAASAEPAPGDWALSRVARIGQTVNATESTILPVWIPTRPAALLVAGQGSDLTAYDASDPTGTVLWRFHPGGTVYSPPAYDPRTGRIFFGATDKRLYAVDSRGLFLWSFPTGDNVATRPAVVGDVVVFGSEDRVVYGVDAATGKLRWRRVTAGPVVSSPAVVGRTVVIGSDDGGIYALDAATGKERWVHRADDAVEAAVVAAGGVVYAAGRDGVLRALDPGSGKALWTAEVGNVVRAAPAVGESAAYVVDSYGYVKAFDLRNGNRLWTTPQAGYAGTPVRMGGDLYVARSDGGVHRLRPDGSRAREWKAPVPPQGSAPRFYLGAAAGGGAVWLADASAGVWRLGAPTGASEPLTLAWSRTVSEKPFQLGLLTGTAVEHGGRALLLDRGNRLYAVDPASGTAELRGSVAPDGRSSMVEPVVSGSTLLAGVGGTVYAVRLPDGKALWSFPGEGMGLRPPTVAGETVLWTTQKDGGGDGKQEGVLYALDLATGRLRWSAPVRGVGAVGGTVARGGTVYLGTPAAAFDLATGRTLWTAPPADPAMGGPALSPAGDVLYTATLGAGGNLGSVRAVRAADGRPRWTATLGDGETLHFLDRLWTAGGLVLVPSLSGRVIALDAATGAERWRYTPEAPRLGAVTVDGGRVYLALQNGQVVVLDAATGRPTARFTDLEMEMGAYSYAQRPVRVGDRLLVTTGVAVLGLRLPR